MEVRRYAGHGSPLVVSRGPRPRPASAPTPVDDLAQRVVDASFANQLAASLAHCGWHDYFVSDCDACIRAATSALPAAVAVVPGGEPVSGVDDVGGPAVVDAPVGDHGGESDARILPFRGRGSDAGAEALAGAALHALGPAGGSVSGALARDPARDAGTGVPAAFWHQPFGFLTGPAGCGKTFAAREYAAAHDGALICATTGIAAVNLGDAVTVHATLKYFDTASLEDHYVSGFLQNRMRKLRASGVTHYILDEVSMMEARQLDVICQCIQDLNDEAAVGYGHEPETRLTLIGDFLQLPPVEGEYAFFARAWERFEANTCRLDTIRRQADPAFIEMLRQIRLGHAEEALPLLRTRCVDRSDLNFDGMTITGVNERVDRFNRMRHERLPGAPLRFASQTVGRPLPEWEKNIPAAIGLRRGAQVVILANAYDGITDEKRLVYANGDQGVLMDADPGKKVAYVQLRRTGQVVAVNYNVKQNKVPNGRRDCPLSERFDVVGEISYLPLRLAYCSTTHKSQGLTLDRVQVDATDAFFRAPSMLYVALSRARSLEGLTIVARPELLLERCTVDPKVERWR